jgi:malonate transporter and related proteins
MDQIVTIVLPVFGIIGIGYLIAWFGVISSETGDAIADFVFAVPIPVLVFRTIATAEIPDGLTPIYLLGVHMLSFLIIWTAGTLAVRRIFGRDARAGVVGGIAAGYGNVFMLGIPLVVTAYGEAALAPVSLAVSLQLPLLLVLSALLIERAMVVDGVASASGGSANIAANAFKNVALNPIIIGAVAGLVWRIGGFEMIGVVESIVDRLADVAGTLALLALGLGLAKYGVSGAARPAIALALLKLMIMPALTLLIVVFVVPLPPIWAKVIVIAAACPSGSNVYIVAARFRTGEALASNTIVLTTVASIVSITFWLSVVEWWL